MNSDKQLIDNNLYEKKNDNNSVSNDEISNLLSGTKIDNLIDEDDIDDKKYQRKKKRGGERGKRDDDDDSDSDEIVYDKIKIKLKHIKKYIYILVIPVLLYVIFNHTFIKGNIETLYNGIPVSYLKTNDNFKLIFIGILYSIALFIINKIIKHIIS